MIPSVPTDNVIQTYDGISRITCALKCNIIHTCTSTAYQETDTSKNIGKCTLLSKDGNMYSERNDGVLLFKKVQP